MMSESGRSHALVERDGGAPRTGPHRLQQRTVAGRPLRPLAVHSTPDAGRRALERTVPDAFPAPPETDDAAEGPGAFRDRRDPVPTGR